MTALAQDCAAAVLEAVPLAMRVIRRHMRSHRIPGMSVPQFRVLGFLDRDGPATLSAVAEHGGTTLPSVSRMVQSLVIGGLVTRQAGATDRRTVRLEITSRGRQILARARAATMTHLADQIGHLPAPTIARLQQSMAVLANLADSPDRACPPGKEHPC